MATPDDVPPAERLTWPPKGGPSLLHVFVICTAGNLVYDFNVYPVLLSNLRLFIPSSMEFPYVFYLRR